MLLTYSKFLSMLLSFFFLSLTLVSSRILEKPLISTNRTRIIDKFQVFPQDFPENYTTNLKDIIGLTRAMSRPTIYIKNRDNPIRQINSFTHKNTSANSLIQKKLNTSNREFKIPNKTSNIILSKQSSTGRKYPNHSSVYRSNGLNHDKKEYSSNEVHFEHQIPDYDAEYYSEENYKTISEEQNDYNSNNNNIEDSVTDPWRISYSLPNMGYFLPQMSMNTMHKRPVLTMLRECNCPSRTTRSYDCSNLSGNFINLLFTLGQNIWALIRLFITSSLPFLIPIIILKLIIIPLKILKVISLIKLFLKFFVILPLFLRIIFPALFNYFNIPSFFLQNILGTPLTYSDPRQVYYYRYDNNFDDLNSVNSTLALRRKENYLNNAQIWNLRTCSNRIACQLGALLSSQADTYLLKTIAIYLSKNADWMEIKNFNSGNNNDNKKEDQMQKNEILKAFLFTLSKIWTKDKCKIYTCSILF